MFFTDYVPEITTPWNLRFPACRKTFKKPLDSVPENEALCYSNDAFCEKTERFLASLDHWYITALTRAKSHIDAMKLKQLGTTDTRTIDLIQRDINMIDELAQAAYLEEKNTVVYSYLDGYDNATPCLNDLREINYVCDQDEDFEF